MGVLPSKNTIWEEKSAWYEANVLPLLEVHNLGLELDPKKTMIKAVEIFRLWGAEFVTFRFHFDATKSGVTVFGFTIVHPSIPSDSTFAFFPIAIYRGPESAFFLRMQAPKAMHLLEQYAKDYKSTGGFEVLSAAAGQSSLKYQLFINVDWKALSGSTGILGCLLCSYTWQGARKKGKAPISSIAAFQKEYGKEKEKEKILKEGEKVYKYENTHGAGIYMIHKALANGERMLAPDFLHTRLLEELLKSEDRNHLTVRPLMLIMDLLLHALKRMVEKGIRSCLKHLMSTEFLTCF
jgi:hypothetical protein